MCYIKNGGLRENHSYEAQRSLMTCARIGVLSYDIMSSNEAQHSLMTCARIGVLPYDIMSSNEAQHSLMTCARIGVLPYDIISIHFTLMKSIQFIINF